MDACPTCGAALETPLGCGSCGALLDADESLTPWELFGLEAGPVDPKVLRRRLLRLGRLVHPDFFGAASAEQRGLAERNSARLNRAHETLADDFARLDWIVKHLGGPDENAERQMPQAFLMEVLEWNEALEEARGLESGAPVPTSLIALGETWERERRTTLDRVEALLTPWPERESETLVAARRDLNAARYLDRALEQLETLRLERAPAR